MRMLEPDSSSPAVPYRLGGLHFPELRVPSVKNVLSEPPLHWLGGLNEFLLAHSKCYDRIEFHHARSVFISLGCFGKEFKIGIMHFYQTRLVVIVVAAAVIELKERPEKMAQAAKWHLGKQEDMSADP